MAAAVLCNGPSRVAYQPSSKYNFVIGCNIPWTTVDATVVLDEQVIRLWNKKPTLITCPTYFSTKAWMETDAVRNREFFRTYFAGMVKPKYPYHSSGHNACEVAINLGHVVIDVYGCDSMFSNETYSYTRTFIKNGGGNQKHINGWRTRWQEIQDSHPNVMINFVK